MLAGFMTFYVEFVIESNAADRRVRIFEVEL